MDNSIEDLSEIVDELRDLLERLKSDLDGDTGGESASTKKRPLFPCGIKPKADQPSVDAKPKKAPRRYSLIKNGAEVDQPNRWNDFLGKLQQRNDDDVREILRYEFEREVDIMKSHKHENGKAVLFATYTSKDTILNKALRMTPPDNVLEYFEKVLPAYKNSRALFEIVRKMVLTDNRWKEFIDKCREIHEEKLPEEDIEHILKIRHTDEELTILAKAVRKNPPLKVINLLLKVYREALSLPHTGGKNEWGAGWIPLHYALQYQASSEVAIALIPTPSDVEKFDFLKQIDVLGLPDYHNRTLLHWAAYHNASMDTITALKKASLRDQPLKDPLRIKDHCGHVPYQTAIWHGRPVDVIESFFVPRYGKGDEIFETFQDVLERLIRSLTDMKGKDDNGTNEDKKSNANDSAHPQCGCDEMRDSLKNMKVDSVRSLFTFSPHRDVHSHYTYMHYDLHSISERVTGNKALQRVVTERTCKASSVFLTMTEFYNCIMIIVSYHYCSKMALSGVDITRDSTIWLFLLFISLGHMVFREITDILTAQARWFNIWNIFDVVTISLVVSSFVRMCLGQTDGNFGSLAVITSAFLWMDAIFFLRSTFISFAVFVSGIIRIISDLVPFFVVSLLMLAAFAQMFMIDHLANDRCPLNEEAQGVRFLKAGDDGSNVTGTFCTLEESFFAMYGLFVDGIEIEDYAEGLLMKGLSIVFGFLVAVILLNLVIAILNNSWADVMKESKRVYWEHKIDFLITVKNYEEFFQKFSCCRSSRKNGKSLLQNALDAMDRNLARICQPFWPGQKYLGNFRSMFERICGGGPGSFHVQLIYEFVMISNASKKDSTKENKTDSKKKDEKQSKILILLKAFVLMTIFWTVAAIWFVVGLFTCGLLWPRAIRTCLFGQGLSDTADETKESSDKAKVPPKRDMTSMEINIEKKVSNSELMDRLISMNEEMRQILLHQADKDNDLSYADDDLPVERTFNGM